MNKAPNDALLRGPDGKVQARKLASWICFVVGLALLVQGSLLQPSAEIEARIAPAIVALVFSLLFWGLVTVQNVVQLVTLLKGQAAPQPPLSEQGSTKEAFDGK
jgi:hypothetical protein